MWTKLKLAFTDVSTTAASFKHICLPSTVSSNQESFLGLMHFQCGYPIFSWNDLRQVQLLLYCNACGPVIFLCTCALCERHTVSLGKRLPASEWFTGMLCAVCLWSKWDAVKARPNQNLKTKYLLMNGNQHNTVLAFWINCLEKSQFSLPLLSCFSQYFVKLLKAKGTLRQDIRESIFSSIKAIHEANQ